jgi:ADP-ribose pyrophosphatase YjhB (NUDIX family)
MSIPLHPVDIFLILTSGNKVLLGKREGTGYADGTWNLPSGKMEIDEDAVTGVLRESREEIGIRLDLQDVRLVTTVHHRNAEGGSRIGLFFAADHDAARHGQPFNAEPNKCSEVGWFPLDGLPDPTYRYTSAGLKAFLHRDALRLDGWR